MNLRNAFYALFAFVASSIAAPPNDSVVTFNELHYNPAGAGDAGEWIELQNQMAVNVDLSGWRLNGGVNYLFPNGTVVPGGGRIVVAKTPGGIAGSVGPFTGSLNNAGETVELVNNSGRLMDSLAYEDSGDWPVAPDGGGVTLAKRDPYTASAEARNWASSAQLGGTPGAVNYPPPPPPVRSQAISRNATWKYNTSGIAVPVDWKTLAFDDAAWASGQGGFTFGSGAVYMDPPAYVPGGIWSTLRWTGDADSGISTIKTYTHKIGLHRGGAYSPINGVVFDSPGAGVFSGANWALTGATLGFANNGNGAGANNLPPGTGSRQLCEEFFYGAANAGGTSRLQLSGLTPDQGYILTLYVSGFGGPGGRLMQLTPSDTNRPFVVDENAAGSGEGILVKYHYKGPASGTITFDFLPLGTNATWHHYAFSNELTVLVPPGEVPSTASISSFSSQLTNGFSRGAANIVNGSGLLGGRHTNATEGNMWLTTGTFTTPNDPLPAEVTFDLGAVKRLTSFHVWNYNEAGGLSTRGANQVEVLVADNVAGPFTSAGTYTFIKASEAITEPGQHIQLDYPNIRYVRFNILTNHSGDNQFAGLSEVQFFVEGTPSQLPVVFREKIPTVFNTGIAANGLPLSPGAADPHYFNLTNNTPAVVETNNPAWLVNDGISLWSGLTAFGTDSVAAGQFTWRTTFDLSGYTSPDLQFYVAVDNVLDNVLLNGVAKSITTAGFTSFVGPYSLAGATAGVNTVDFIWTNQGATPNPSGIRIKWDATGQPTLAKTTLPANPVTTYFRKTFTATGSGTSTYRLLLNYVADDGAIFYVNGTEVHRVNVTGAATHTTPADSDEAYPMFTGEFEIPASAVLPGNNVLAVELHQASAGNADAFFLATLDVVEIPAAPSNAPTLQFNEIAGATAGTFFLEVRNTTGSALSLNGYSVVAESGATYNFGAVSIPAGGLLALDQGALGFRPLDGEKLFLNTPSSVADAVVVKNSPQARDASGRWLRPSSTTPNGINSFSLTEDVVINEIMYHHQPEYLPTGVIEDPEEWVELLNRGSSAVDLTGWRLRGGADFDFPGGTIIGPGQYLVVSNNPQALLTRFPGINVVGPMTGTLSNQEDVVRIEDANGNPADEVNYHHRGRWNALADGGGSSLELRNPAMDNSKPEAWAPSNEAPRAEWATVQYQGAATPFPGSNDPTQYNEFILGLLADGEFLVDDVSVKEVSVGNRELIQNGGFSSGDASTWRNLGTHGSHGRTVVVDDPDSPGNKVLRVVATGPTEHMHNHCETTLKSGGSFVTIVSENVYDISFRVRWVNGSPRLNSRLYFNRLAQQILLPVPLANGTPGGPNSRQEANPGPTFNGLSHAPVLPDANTSVAVRIQAADPQGVANVVLKWRKDGDTTFTSTPMVLTDGTFEGTIPGQAQGALVQFYVEATDGAGGVSTFPAEGASSRALVRWKDGIAPTTNGHGVRLLMLTADADFLHLPTNVMSNDMMPCTVVYRETEVFYNARVRLKSSERGRMADVRVGFNLEFDPMQKFRGAHEGVNLDRSGYGRGTTGSGNGISDIVSWHMFNRAGGVASMYNDLAYLIAPRSVHNGSAQLVMAEFNDIWLDSQFNNGAQHPVFKYELIYFPTTTTGGPEGLKIPNPDDVRGIEFESLSTDNKEAFRWNFLIGNARTDDDYSGILELNQTFKLTGGTFAGAIPETVDVDQWMRSAAALTLAGIGDNYISSSGAWHNLKLYARGDGRILYLPWDLDFQNQPSNAALVINPDIQNIINASPAYQRLFFQHLHDIISTSFNTTYLGPWITHFQTLNTTGGDWNSFTTYINERVAFVQAQLNATYPAVPFEITTNGGNDFNAAGANVPLSGSGWINVRTIRVQASGVDLPVQWNGSTWSVLLPIAPGANVITLQAVDYQGNLVGSDTIAITGTGTIVPASGANLTITEIHYHPAQPNAGEASLGFTDKEEFEFLEVRNISTQNVSLAGCYFSGGIDFEFPSVNLAPGAYAVVARNSSAFAARYQGVTPIGQYYRADGNFLANGGEQIALVSVSTGEIARVSYGDSGDWPTNADGDGKSLVLIAPKTDPDVSDPLHWRASALNHGNPGGGDAMALPANLEGDDDGDGLTNLVEHAISIGSLPTGGVTTLVSGRHLTMTLQRHPQADVNWNIERSTAPPAWGPAAFEITERVMLPNGLEQITLRAELPTITPGDFFRAKLSAQP